MLYKFERFLPFVIARTHANSSDHGKRNNSKCSVFIYSKHLSVHRIGTWFERSDWANLCMRLAVTEAVFGTDKAFRNFRSSSHNTHIVFARAVSMVYSFMVRVCTNTLLNWANCWSLLVHGGQLTDPEQTHSRYIRIRFGHQHRKVLINIHLLIFTSN